MLRSVSECETEADFENVVITHFSDKEAFKFMLQLISNAKLIKAMQNRRVVSHDVGSDSLSEDMKRIQREYAEKLEERKHEKI